MKGVIFTELVRFMEELQSPAFADQVICEAGFPHDGAYTSVGNYSHAEAVTMVTIAARLADVDATYLCRKFGTHLFDRFLVLYPQIMAEYRNADDLLKHVGDHIHNEVCVLYPDAIPPRIETTHADGNTTVSYRSHRPMAAIAYGLIEGCMAHYGDDRILDWQPDASSKNAVFSITAARDR